MTQTQYRGQGLDLGNQKLTSVAAGTNPTDAANWGQVSDLVRGQDWKQSVLAATTTNVALTGEQTIDGVTTSASRVLVKNQTAGAQNGIYVTGSGAWTRTADFSDGVSVTSSAVVPVEQGATNGDKFFFLATDGTLTVGTTAQVWSQLSSGGTVYTNGTGISIVGSVIAATGPQKYAAAVPAGQSSTAITHGLNTTDVQVTVYDISGAAPVQVLCDVAITSATVVTLGFAAAPTTGQYRVVVIG